MKKISGALLMVVILFVCSACGSSGAGTAENKGASSDQKVTERPIYKDVVLFSVDKINNYEYNTFVAYLEEKGYQYSTKEEPTVDGYYTVTVKDGSKYDVQVSFWPDVDMWGGYAEWEKCDKTTEDYINSTILSSVTYGSELYGIEFGVDPTEDHDYYSNDFTMSYRTYDGVENKGVMVDSMEDLEEYANTVMEEHK